MTYVLVLNAGYEPLHRVSINHAITMLVRGVAVVEEADTSATFGPFPIPRVLRLVRYIKMAWRYRRRPGWSRAGLFARDGYRCGYCGQFEANLTVDHIIPKSRGGATSWTNTVTACGGRDGCNSKKADRTPAEAGMTLLVSAGIPSWEQTFLTFEDAS